MYMNIRVLIRALLLLLSFLSLGAAAGQTKLAVYVLAKDAKFIGDYTGGAQVTIKHRDSGEILAQGLTTGGIGNTDKIMKTTTASQKIDKSAAFFLADLTVDVATPVIIEAKGPMDYLQSVHQVSVSSWVYPDQMARPVVIEMPGYIVEGEYTQVTSKCEFRASERFQFKAHWCRKGRPFQTDGTMKWNRSEAPFGWV